MVGFARKQALWAIMLGGVLAAGPALAAPGDPFGGDDAGCVPSTKLGLICAKKALATLVKLRASVLKCHLTMAGLAFQTGHSSPGFSNSEDNCEDGNPSNSAKAKFDARMAALAGIGCDATLLANANARGATILADQGTTGSMDALNGTFFCDATSGDLLDPGGDDAGYIPATAANYKCSVVVAKAWAKLDKYLYSCHTKAAAVGFKSGIFDEEACEDTGLKSAHAKYDAYVNRYIAAGICPPCLVSGAPTLGTDTVAGADADLDEVYICPGP